MPFQEGCAIADLALAGGHASALIDFHQHRDMSGLDEIEEVLACEIKRAADEDEADHAAPQGAACRCVTAAAHVAKAPAERCADANGDDIGKCNARIHNDAQDDK